MKRFLGVFTALLLCVIPAFSSQGYVGFGTNHGVIAYDGTFDSFPGMCQLPNTGKLIIFYAAGGNNHSPNTLSFVTKTSQAAAPSAATVLVTPPAANAVSGAECNVIGSKLWINYYVYPDSGAAATSYVNSATIASDDTLSWGSATSPTTPSGCYSTQWNVVASKIFTLQNGHLVLPFQCSLLTAPFAVQTSAGLLFSVDSGATWGNPVFVGTGDATNYFSEMECVTIGAGYPNANRVYCYIRNDDATSVNSGYYQAYSDAPETSFSTPVQFLAETVNLVGHPAATFIPAGANGGIMFMARWGANTSVLYTPYSLTGYTITWDQGATWLDVRNFAPGNINATAQNWYASCTLIVTTVGCAIALSLENQSVVAWVYYQEFMVVAP